MKIKLSLLLLILCFVFACAHAEPVNGIPSVGDEINGFTVTAIEDFDLLNAKVVYMTHNKTESPLIWIANDDTERSFTIGFRTHYENDKGVPHVFEHAALSGSVAYPDPQLFFALQSNTCQTYLNAATYPFQTVYPCASISDVQLLKQTDIYLAGVFEPLVITDEHAMRREAYRYELENADADLVLTGTVYSEMLGSYYANQEYYERSRLMYPGSWYTTCTGGQPGYIETMTHEDLIEFHNTYYQPSNALTILYGDLDLDPFLSLIAGYFDRYEKTDVSTEDPNYVPFTGYSEVSADVCASADAASDTTHTYCVPIRGYSDEDALMLSTFLPSALNNQASALYTRMMQDYPASSFNVALLTNDGPEPMLVFELGNAAGVTAAQFASSIRESLVEVLNEGIHYEFPRANVKLLRKSNALKREGSNIGVNLSESIMSGYSLTGNVDSYFRTLPDPDACEAWFESGIMETVIREQVIDPENSRVITINKIPGTMEIVEQEAAQRLVDKKAAMSPEEIEKTIADTREYNEWADSLNEISMINEVTMVTIDNLPENVKTVQSSVTNVNGVRYITSAVDNSDLIYITLYFRADWIPVDQLKYYMQSTYQLDSIYTGTHTTEELSGMMDEYSISIRPGMLSDGADKNIFIPVLEVNIVCLKEDLGDAVALMNEIMTDARFDDLNLIRYSCASSVYSIKTIAPQQAPHSLAHTLAEAAENDSSLYAYYLGDIPFCRYLESLADLDDEALTEESAIWSDMLRGLYNREGLQVTIVSDAEGIVEAEACLNGVISGLPFSSRSAVDYRAELPRLPKRIGIKIPGSVCYNIQLASLDHTGYTYSPELDILNSLVYDRILIPVMRYRNGVYSPVNSIDEESIFVLAYRDPSPVKTFDEVIPSISKGVAEMDIDQDSLDNLIVAGYTKLARPVGPYSLALTAVNDILTNQSTQRDTLLKMAAYKSLTVEKLIASAGIYDKLAEEGAIVTAGPASVIDANADRYDMVISWFIE